MRRYLLWTVIGSAIVIAGALVVAMFIDEVLLLVPVAIILGAASLALLACLHARERGHHRRFMIVGMTLIPVAAALMMVPLLALLAEEFWSGVSLIDWQLQELLWSIALTVMLVALVPVQWALLSLVRLDRKLYRRLRLGVRWGSMLVLGMFVLLIWWESSSTPLLIIVAAAVQAALIAVYLWMLGKAAAVRVLAHVLAIAYILFIALIVLGSTLFSDFVGFAYTEMDWWLIYQLTNAAAFILILATGTIPLLAWLESIGRRQQVGSIRDLHTALTITCPRCDHQLAIHTGRDRCGECGLIFRIELEEPRCECGYLLYRRHDDVCPECGRALPAAV